MEDKEFLAEFKRVIDNDLVPHADDLHKASKQMKYKPLLNARIGIPKGEENLLTEATVKRQAVDVDGKPIVMATNNLLTDTRKYEIKYDDGTIETLAVNAIAENIFIQVDEEGKWQVMLDEIIDHRVLNNAIPKEKGTYKTRIRITRNKPTTRGWEICVQWKTGDTDWVSLKDLRDLFPIESAVCCYEQLAR